MGRRGAGEGSVYKQNDGLWAVSIELGRDPVTGKRRRKVVRARTKRDALAKAATIRHSVSRGLPVTDDRLTVASWIETWARDVLPGTVKETTATGYVWLLNRYVVPRIGKKMLSKLTPLEVQRMLRDLEAEGYAPRTRRQVRSVLRRALADAERWGMVARNVAALVDAPAVDSSKLDDVLTPEEGQKVLAAVEDDRLQALAVLVMTTGMRKGEAMALRWVDVDLDAGTVRVAGTLKRAKGRWWIDTPKTAAGKRAIPVEAWVVESLREHRRHQAEERLALGPDWADHDFVFTTPIGTPLDGRNVTRWWHGVCATAGIERRRFHALRHSVATWLADEGEPLEVIGERLGHSSHAVTVDIYLRVGERAKHQASSTLGRVLGR